MSVLRVTPAHIIIGAVWLLSTAAVANAAQAQKQAPPKAQKQVPELKASTTLTIAGWPQNWQQPVWLLAEEDPLFSALVCPALTQLNLRKNRSEPLLVDKITSDAKTWQITLKKKTALWDGQQVTSTSVADFLKAELAPHIERMFAGRVRIPKATYTMPSATELKIAWQAKPVFGPYVLNSLPFRSKTAAGWQCAGAYKPLAEGDAKVLTLASAAGNRSAKFKAIRFTDDAKTIKSSPHRLNFRFADTFAGNPWRRLSDQKISCKRSMPTSIITAIMWNPTGRHTKDRQFRGAMTHLTPRGALLRSGGGELGKLVSAAVPRHHPGYNRRVFVRSFSYPKGVKILEQLGYKRVIHDKPRTLPDGKTPLVLTIGTLSPEGPLHKVLSDSYMSVGIDLKFVTIKDPAHMKPALQNSLDGVLMGLKIPFPSANILPLLSGKDAPFGDGYASLGRHFIPYLRSITTEKPDFSKLRTAHVAMYQQEPMSVLMQYYQCVNVKSAKVALRKAPDVRNPEWLKTLLF